LVVPANLLSVSRASLYYQAVPPTAEELHIKRRIDEIYAARPFYGSRRITEAANKEIKGPFFVQHLMSRSPAGLQLQVVLTGLAANALRWCRPWLHDCAAAPTSQVTRLLTSPKALIRIAANSSALVHRHVHATSIVFGPHSALPGAAFTFHKLPAVQLPLGFHRPFKTISDSTNRALNAHSLRQWLHRATEPVNDALALVKAGKPD